MARVLIVEDNADLAAGIQYNLSLEGYETHIAEDGRRAIAAAEEWSPDVILLDLMLPELDGYQVLQTLRGRGVKTPVVILTARGEEADKVRGFRLDADQYVTKPFGVLELLERVASLVRRGYGNGAASLTTFGDVCIDMARRVVTRNGAEVELAPKAYDLLLALVRRDGAVPPRHVLWREVGGYGPAVVPRTVDPHVAELRRKREADPAEPRHITTVWKVGYRLT